jgi:hypothetical protein
VVGLVALMVFWRIYFRAREGRKALACDGCAEIGSGRVCSGFAEQAAHLRDYEREATELVVASGYVPPAARSKSDRPGASVS